MSYLPAVVITLPHRTDIHSDEHDNLSTVLHININTSCSLAWRIISWHITPYICILQKSDVVIAVIMTICCQKYMTTSDNSKLRDLH